MLGKRVGKKLGIVIPVLNDWISLEVLIKKLCVQAERNKLDLKLFVVDDGSSEQPPRLLETGPTPIIMQLIRLKNNLGHQCAIAVGLVMAGRVQDIDAVVVMDADGQDRAEDLPILLAAWNQEPNLIVVAKRRERPEGFLFKFFYALYKLSFRVMTGHRIDFGNFCLIPRACLNALTYNAAIWNNLAAAITRSTVRTKSVPLDRGERFFGNSRMNFQSLLVHGVSAMSVYADYVLLRLLIASGFLASISAIAMVVVVTIKFATNWAIPGWATFLAGSLVIILLQALLFFGISLFQLMSLKTVKLLVPALDVQSFILETYELTSSTASSR